MKAGEFWATYRSPPAGREDATDHDVPAPNHSELAMAVEHDRLIAAAEQCEALTRTAREIAKLEKKS